MSARMWWICGPGALLEAGIRNVSSMCAPTRRPASDGLVTRSNRARTWSPVDGDLEDRRRLDDPVLWAAIEAAAQVISREPGLEADLDAGAVRSERHRIGLDELTSASMYAWATAMRSASE